MSPQNKLIKKVKEKQLEIRALESSLKEARAYLQATQEALRLITKEQENSNTAVESPAVRPGSLLDRAFQALRKSGKPLPVMELLKRMGKEATVQNRQSLVGSVGAYARKGQIFVKTGPNQFGLLEWKERDESNEALPEEFGLA